MPIDFIEDSGNTMNLSVPIPEILQFDAVTPLNIVSNESTILNDEFSMIDQYEINEQLANNMPELSGMDNKGDDNLSVTSIISENKTDNDPSTMTDSTKLVQFLQWPKAPERKGKRQMERLPYVLTSTGLKKIYEAKEAEKNAKEQQKEENRLKRLQKAEEKVGKKQKTVNKIKPHNLPLKENYEKTELKNTEKPEESIKRSAHMANQEKHKELKSKPSYVKNIMKKVLEDFADNEFSKYECVASNATTSAILSELPTNNMIKNEGLCFLCTSNVSALRIVVKCQKCAVSL